MLDDLKKQLKEKGIIYFRCKTVPNSHKNEITDIMSDGTVKIRVSAPPEQGKANKRLIKYLSEIFEVKNHQVEISSGQKDRLKLIKIITRSLF